MSSVLKSFKRFCSRHRNLSIVYTKTREVHRVTANDNEWYNERQRVTKSSATSKNGDSIHQGMDDCNSFYNKNRYTTSRDAWLILEWLKELATLNIFQQSSWS